MKALKNGFSVVLIGIVLVALGFLIGGWVFGGFPNPFKSLTEGSRSHVIRSIEREEQIVLLSLGVQGISSETAQRAFKDLEIPGTARATDVQYEFDAKLGIEGKQVVVEEISPSEFTIKVPEFIFIGHENVSFKEFDEDNEVFSWVTSEIQESYMINEVLNPEAKDVYLDGNADLLEEQVVDFYTGIVQSIDPDVKLTFIFS